ncbi:BON domain-containing protein [Amaricoccus solimangrovi]|uniref:BON domain-containing protein n=1 Tax=Amaricoccus solimangrovi TaxID=2589815 RepID=A0A501WTJ3_9RHOB|nr:SWFGD domain-containing protein [Amaricoccus solimangrovi]TPE51635.1 BON domain-containing protein [Amaricoccus solimangrovi]
MRTDWENRGRYGRGGYDDDYGRGRGASDRDWSDRAGDEMRSWFGDDDARRRRRMDDERDYGRRGPRDYGFAEGYGEGDRGYRSEYGDYGAGRGYEGGGAFGGGFREDRIPRYDRGGGSRGGYGRGYGGGYARGYGAGYGAGHGGGYGGRAGSRDEERGFMERAGDEIASWFGDDDAQRRRDMDSHRGRGPKNYTRSDERIREDVNDRLSEDSRLDAREIEVSVSGGEVTLQGSIGERFEKRRAEDIAEDVLGVTHVQNNLRVKTREDRSVSTTTTGGGSTPAM